MTDEQKLAQDSQTGAPVSPPPIADRVFETSTLDEMEETGNRLVSPHWISPRARGRHAEAGFQFHGSKNLFALDVHYGRDLIVHHPDQPDDRIAFVMALGGSLASLMARRRSISQADRGSFSRLPEIRFILRRTATLRLSWSIGGDSHNTARI